MCKNQFTLLIALFSIALFFLLLAPSTPREVAKLLAPIGAIQLATTESVDTTAAKLATGFGTEMNDKFERLALKIKFSRRIVTSVQIQAPFIFTSNVTIQYLPTKLMSSATFQLVHVPFCLISAKNKYHT